MKKQIKDVIKYANLITMLGLGNVACATVQQAQPEKSFSIHKEASDTESQKGKKYAGVPSERYFYIHNKSSDPEREKEAEYNKNLIEESEDERKDMTLEELKFDYNGACADIVIMTRYKKNTNRLWDDMVDWYNGKISINPTYYTYEEDKRLSAAMMKKCGTTEYVIENNKFICPSNSKER